MCIYYPCKCFLSVNKLSDNIKILKTIDFKPFL